MLAHAPSFCVHVGQLHAVSNIVPLSLCPLFIHKDMSVPVKLEVCSTPPIFTSVTNNLAGMANDVGSYFVNVALKCSSLFNIL